MGQSLSTNNRHHGASYRQARVWLVGALGAFLILLAAGCGSLAGEPVATQDETYSPGEKLKPNGAAEFDRLGISLDLEHPLIVIASLGSSLPTSEGGAAHIYAFDGGSWNHQAVLDEQAVARSGFGHAVATDGERVVVTAPLDSSDQFRAGAAYVYVRNGDQWLLEQTLVPDEVDEGSRFGVAVDIDGGRIAVASGGSPRSVHLFELEGGEWKEIELITATTDNPLLHFGWAIELSGEWLAVSEMNEDDTLPGSVYLYRGDGGDWPLVNQFESEPAADRFGASLALDGERLLVGSPSISAKPTVHAFALVQERWVPDGQLREPEGGASHFGTSVDLDEGVAIVGAPGADSNAGDSTGRAYLFVRPSDSYLNPGADWLQRMTFEALTPREEDSFGVEVAIDRNLVLVGATGDDEVARDSGAAYLFRIMEALDVSQP